MIFECRGCRYEIEYPDDYVLFPSCGFCGKYYKIVTSWRKFIKKLINYIS